MATSVSSGKAAAQTTPPRSARRGHAGASPTTADLVAPGVGRGRRRRPQGPHADRLLQGRGEVGGDVPRDRRRALVDPRRLRLGRRRRHAHAARPRLGAASTPAARRSSPKRSRRRSRRHPAVRDAVVVGVPDDRFGEAITAVVELARDASTRPTRRARQGPWPRTRRPRVLVVDRHRPGRERQGRLQALEVGGHAAHRGRRDVNEGLDLRHRFPGLSDGWSRFDGPAGTQVVDSVVAAVATALASPSTANSHGLFPRARPPTRSSPTRGPRWRGCSARATPATASCSERR